MTSAYCATKGQPRDILLKKYTSFSVASLWLSFKLASGNFFNTRCWGAVDVDCRRLSTKYASTHQIAQRVNEAPKNATENNETDSTTKERN